MFCSKCGNKLIDGLTACWFCGTEITGVEEESVETREELIEEPVYTTGDTPTEVITIDEILEAKADIPRVRENMPTHKKKTINSYLFLITLAILVIIGGVYFGLYKSKNFYNYNEEIFETENMVYSIELPDVFLLRADTKYAQFIYENSNMSIIPIEKTNFDTSKLEIDTLLEKYNNSCREIIDCTVEGNDNHDEVSYGTIRTYYKQQQYQNAEGVYYRSFILLEDNSTDTLVLFSNFYWRKEKKLFEEVYQNFAFIAATIEKEVRTNTDNQFYETITHISDLIENS